MKKVLAIAVAAAVSMMGMIGCSGLTDPTSSTTPKITIDNIGSITAGTYKNVTGKIEAGDSITNITYSIVDANKVAVALTVIGVTGPTANNAKKQEFTAAASPIVITPKTSAPAGSYQLKLSVTAAGATTDGFFDFTVANSTVVPVGATKSDPLTLGANQNSAGGSINLDIPQVYTGSQASAVLSTIDLCYAHSSTTGDKLGTPNWAKLSGFSFTNSWSGTLNATKFYKTTFTSANFDTISIAGIAAAWNEASATAESYTAAANDVFIAKTDLNAIVLLLVQSQVAGATGTIVVKTAK